MQRGFYKLNYNLSTPQERVQFVKELLSKHNEEPISSIQLDYLTNYIIQAIPLEERKGKFLTDSRMVTVRRREISYENLSGTLESGEDGIYSIATTNPHQYLTIRNKGITEEEYLESKDLQEVLNTIQMVEKQLKNTTDKHQQYILSKQLKDLHQTKYIIKESVHPQIHAWRAAPKNIPISFSKEEIIKVTNNGEQVQLIQGVSLIEPTHVAAILSLYNRLKIETSKDVTGDIKYLIEEFDEIFLNTFKEKNPVYFFIATQKINGVGNKEIRRQLIEKFNISHTEEYLSTIWTKKIPKMISELAIDKYLDWYYTYKDYGKWKRCSFCGQIKLRNKRNFSLNSHAKDGYYSQCKECRNKKASDKRKAANNNNNEEKNKNI